MPSTLLLLILLMFPVAVVAADPPAPLDQWHLAPPDAAKLQVKDGGATLTSEKWAYLAAAQAAADVELSAAITLRAASSIRYFGKS